MKFRIQCPPRRSAAFAFVAVLVFFAGLTTACYVRSLFFRDSLYFSTPRWGGVVSSSAGGITHGGDIWTRPQGWRIERQAIPCPEMDWREPVFKAHVSSGGRNWEFRFSYLLLLVLMLALLMVFLLTENSERRDPGSPEGGEEEEKE